MATTGTSDLDPCAVVPAVAFVIGELLSLGAAASDGGVVLAGALLTAEYILVVPRRRARRSRECPADPPPAA